MANVKTVAVKGNQNLQDIGLQELGSVEGLFDLVEANGLMPDDDLVLGQVMTLPAIVRADIVNYFSNELGGYVVATEPITPLADSGGSAFSDGFSMGFS